MEKDLNTKIEELSKKVAVIGNNIEKQGNDIEKLTSAFERLAIFIEKTNENNKKIDILFKKVDEVYNNGTKSCPVNGQRLNSLEFKIDSLTKWLVTLGVSFLMALFGLVLHLLEKHLL